VKRFVFLIALFPFALFLTACGSSPGQPLDQQRADELKVVAPYLASSVVNGLRQSSSPTSNLIGLSGVSGDCGPSVTTLSDQDSDSIPASYNATFKDCTEDKFFFIEVKNGNVTLSDADDTNPKSGLFSKGTDVRFDWYSKENNAPKDKFVSILSNWDVDVAVTSSAASIDYGLSVELTTFRNNQADKTWQGSLEFTGSYAPLTDNDLNNFDAGTINVDGELTLGDFLVREKIINLTFDESCLAGPKGGSIRFEDGKGNFLEMTYTGCNTGTFSYNSSGMGTF
jgi:hypothetical protein